MPIPGNFLSATTEMVDPNTSGWTAKLNCSLTKGTGGRNGDGCLVVKSIVAGEVQARTVSSYPVVPATTYQTFADAAGAVPERIGIRWLNASGTEISITWSLTTMAASSSWHRVGVAGVAPPAAAQAQVLLSSTPAAGLVNHYWENVFFGLPIRVLGNLFAFTTESTEVDASGWVSEVNASTSRQVPAVTWAVNNYTAGGHTLAVTATAAGNTGAEAIDRPAVTPGVDYLAYAYLQPPTLASTAWIELRFYDVNGNQIAAQRSTLVPPGTGMYRQRASMIAPGTAATCSVAAGLDGASAGQILRLETVVVRAAPQAQAGTILTYSASSFEQSGSSTWEVASGLATAARSTPWGAVFFDGAYSLEVTSPTATISVLRSGRFLAPNVAGQNWRAQILVRGGAGSWASINVRIRWYDADDVDLGATGGSSYALPESGTWYVMPGDAVAPPGATQAAIEVTVTASSPDSVLSIDWAALWQVLPLTAVQAVDDRAYVQLTLRELPLDFLITVHREGPDGGRTLVRGASGLIDQQPITSNLMVIEDHEAPLGVPVRYRITMYDPASGATSTRSSSLVTLTHTDTDECWVKDPGRPYRNMKVVVRSPPEWDRPIQQTVHRVRGRRAPVIRSDVRGSLEGDLVVMTRSDGERAALHQLLDSGDVLLWQAAPGMGVTDMYVSIGTVPEGRIPGPASEPWRTWTLPLIEVDMPTTVGVGGSAGRTWQDVLTEYGTWQALADSGLTWEQVLLGG